MSTRLRIPISAQCVRQFQGVIPSGARAGQHLALFLWAGFASKGYRSGYQTVPARWLEAIFGPAGGPKERSAWGYSGNRLEQADRDFDQNVADLQAAQTSAA